MEQGLTIISAKSKLQVGLTKAQLSIQQLLNELNDLEYNEDNLDAIKAAIGNGKRVKQIIEDEHRRLKAPALQECKAWDESKNEMVNAFSGQLEVAIQKHQKICADIETRRKEAKAAEARRERIMGEIDSIIITYSAAISECKTIDHLLKNERLFNLATGNESVFGEFLPQLQERAIPIRELIKAKKIILKELNPLLASEGIHQTDEELEYALDRKEALEEKLDDIGLKLVEKASDQASQSKQLEATQIFPEVKAKRTTYKWEIYDLQMVMRKTPLLVTIIPNNEALKNELAKVKIEMVANNLERVNIDGITYYKEQTF